MRILFDGYWAVDGPPSGRMVLLESLRAWTKFFPEDELVLAVPRRSRLMLQDLVPQIKVISTVLPSHPFINGVELPIRAREHKADCVVAHNFGPLAGKSVTIMHDVLFQSNPSWFTASELVYCSLMPIMGRGPTQIVTTTESESDRIRNFNPKINVGQPIGLGISTALRDAVSIQPDIKVQPGEFVLTVGRLNVRKNLSETILGGLDSGVITTDCPLVVVGEQSGAMERWDPRIVNAIEKCEIILAGFIPDPELRWLYENCAFMAFLSLDEGFGLPPVEAVSLGAKVLVSDIPVMRENLGKTACYVNPKSRQAIAAGFKSIRADSIRLTHTSQSFEWKAVVTRLRSQIIGKLNGK